MTAQRPPTYFLSHLAGHFNTLLPLVFTDQTGRSLNVASNPQRIVSCVPSQTELLSDLGLESQVVGITKFCVHPSNWRKQKTIVGGTKNLNLQKIAGIAPDFILANKEENDQTQIEWLASRFPTYVSDVRNMNQALEMIQEVGIITSRIVESTQIVNTIESVIKSTESLQRKPSACYLIWKSPWMTINHDTFIHDMLCRQGFRNVFADRHDSRYPIINEAELQGADPEILFLSSEPYPFNTLHMEELQQLLPRTRIYLINGESLSWYGSRLCRFDQKFFDEIRKQQ